MIKKCSASLVICIMFIVHTFIYKYINTNFYLKVQAK